MADDHAAHAISAYGSRINQTPNIDRIATGGVRLTNCFCTNSICTPSRAAILTGQYSHKNGVYTLDDRLDPKRNHVAKELQTRRLPDRDDRQVAPGQRSRPASTTGTSCPARASITTPTSSTTRTRKKYTGYCTDLIGDFTLDWLKQRDTQEAVLPDVPPQSAAPPLAARSEIQEPVRGRRPSPSPTICSITTKDAPAPSPPSP